MEIAIGGAPAGNIDIELYDDQAPQTVANFLRYAGSGNYSKFTSQGATAVSFISRSVRGFVIQGGGYAYSDLRTGSGVIANYVAYSQVPKAAPVPNEFSPSRSNVRGTIAMAKLPNDPNSATNEWFINLADNSANLDNQNGGFTVFGKVIDTAQDPGMSVVDTIANLPVLNESGYDTFGNQINYPILNGSQQLTSTPLCSSPCSLPMAALNTVPVDNYDSTKGLDPGNLVSITSIPNVKSTPTLLGRLMTFTSDVDMTFDYALTEPQDISTLLLQEFTPPPGMTAQFNDGIFKFGMKWTQGSTSRIVTLHNDDPATANRYYAYGPTPDNANPHWYDFSYDAATGTGAEFVGDKILLHFVDGQRGDNDTVGNNITHLGAPAFVTETSSPTSTTAGGCSIAATSTRITNHGDWILVSMFLAFVALVRKRVSRDRI